MVNEILWTPNFKRLYKTKETKVTKKMMERVDKAILDLRNSDEPERLGKKKKGRISSYFSYELGKRHRILYKVERSGEAVSVSLHRICDHKQVYDKG